MRRSYHPQIIEELLEACRLASDASAFEGAFEQTTLEVCDAPQAWMFTGVGSTRKATVGRYPYHLIFEVTDDEVCFIALAHKRREPLYWINRTESRE